VVRRLVEQEHVGLGEQEAREAEAVLLPAGEDGGLRRPRLALEAEAHQNRLGLSRVLEAAEALELVLQLAVAFEHPVEVVAGLGHAVFELVHLVLDALEVLEGGERRLMDGRARLEVDVLFEQPEAQAARAHHLAAVGRLLAGDEAEEGRLARAVAADQPDVLAGVELHGEAAQHVLRAVRLVYVGEAEQHI
jgi:hypothetical protein